MHETVIGDSEPLTDSEGLRVVSYREGFEAKCLTCGWFDTAQTKEEALILARSHEVRTS